MGGGREEGGGTAEYRHFRDNDRREALRQWRKGRYAQAAKYATAARAYNRYIYPDNPSKKACEDVFDLSTQIRAVHALGNHEATRKLLKKTRDLVEDAGSYLEHAANEVQATANKAFLSRIQAMEIITEVALLEGDEDLATTLYDYVSTVLEKVYGSQHSRTRAFDSRIRELLEEGENAGQQRPPADEISSLPLSAASMGTGGVGAASGLRTLQTSSRSIPAEINHKYRGETHTPWRQLQRQGVSSGDSASEGSSFGPQTFTEAENNYKTGLAMKRAGHVTAGMTYLEQAKRLYLESGDKSKDWYVSRTEIALGKILLNKGDNAEALCYFKDAFARRYQTLGDAQRSKETSQALAFINTVRAHEGFSRYTKDVAPATVHEADEFPSHNEQISPSLESSASIASSFSTDQTSHGARYSHSATESFTSGSDVTSKEEESLSYGWQGRTERLNSLDGYHHAATSTASTSLLKFPKDVETNASMEISVYLNREPTNCNRTQIRSEVVDTTNYGFSTVGHQSSGPVVTSEAAGSNGQLRSQRDTMSKHTQDGDSIDKDKNLTNTISSDPSTWSTSDTCKFLSFCGLDNYIEAFRTSNVRGSDILEIFENSADDSERVRLSDGKIVTIGEGVLTEDLGMRIDKHRDKLFYALESILGRSANRHYLEPIPEESRQDNVSEASWGSPRMDGNVRKYHASSSVSELEEEMPRGYADSSTETAPGSRSLSLRNGQNGEGRSSTDTSHKQGVTSGGLGVGHSSEDEMSGSSGLKGSISHRGNTMEALTGSSRSAVTSWRDLEAEIDRVLAFAENEDSTDMESSAEYVEWLRKQAQSLGANSEVSSSGSCHGSSVFSTSTSGGADADHAEASYSQPAGVSNMGTTLREGKEHATAAGSYEESAKGSYRSGKTQGTSSSAASHSSEDIAPNEEMVKSFSSESGASSKIQDSTAREGPESVEDMVTSESNAASGDSTESSTAMGREISGHGYEGTRSSPSFTGNDTVAGNTLGSMKYSLSTGISETSQPLPSVNPSNTAGEEAFPPDRAGSASEDLAIPAAIDNSKAEGDYDREAHISLTDTKPTASVSMTTNTNSNHSSESNGGVSTSKLISSGRVLTGTTVASGTQESSVSTATSAPEDGYTAWAASLSESQEKSPTQGVPASNSLGLSRRLVSQGKPTDAENEDSMHVEITEKQKVVSLNGTELWNRVSFPLQVLGLLVRVKKQRLLQRVSWKTVSIGVMISSVKTHRLERRSLKFFAFGYLRLQARYRTVRRVFARVFTMGYLVSSIKREHKRLEKARMQALKKAREKQAKQHGNKPKLRGVHWELLDDIKGTIWDEPGKVAHPGSEEESDDTPHKASKAKDLAHLLGLETHLAKYILQSSHEKQRGSIDSDAVAQGDPIKHKVIGQLFPDLHEQFGGSNAGTKNGGNANASEGKSETRKKVAKKKAETIFDGKTSQNMNIALSRVKMPFEELRDYIERADLESIGGIETVQLLSGLNAYSTQVTKPVKEHVDKKLEEEGNDNSGENSSAKIVRQLGLAEQYVWTISLGVDCIRDKLDALDFMGTYRESLSVQQYNLNIVRAACDEIVGSVKFASLLRDILLPLGNKLNEGSRRGVAVGFRVSTLKALAQTKANNQMNLLEYVIDRLETRKSAIIDLKEDFQHLEPASKLSLATIDSELKALSKRMRSVEGVRQKLQQNPEINSSFLESLDDFLEEHKPLSDDAMKELDNTHKRFNGAAVYLGEKQNTKVTSEDLFCQLLEFLNLFQDCLTKVRKRRQQQFRDALATSSKSSSLRKVKSNYDVVRRGNNHDDDSKATTKDSVQEGISQQDRKHKVRIHGESMGDDPGVRQILKNETADALNSDYKKSLRRTQTNVDATKPLGSMTSEADDSFEDSSDAKAIANADDLFSAAESRTTTNSLKDFSDARATSNTDDMFSGRGARATADVAHTPPKPSTPPPAFGQSMLRKRSQQLRESSGENDTHKEGRDFQSTKDVFRNQNTSARTQARPKSIEVSMASIRQGSADDSETSKPESKKKLSKKMVIRPPEDAPPLDPPEFRT
eukprot:gb/GECG01010818.1/.p1 GENE.gb/GECG01010818.1/~~gb/GECG01010818.1/.p1  ORF type:complete len:2050 (+),score=324.58 gb/GECG01010818.1/:1-6150(+)